MRAHPTGPREELRIELKRLVMRRTRVALLIGLTTVVGFAVSNPPRASPDRLWGDLINGLTALAIGIAFVALRLPAVQRWSVPYALAIFAFGCFVRTSAGIDQGDVGPTAIILTALALVGAATMPWGVVPQMVIAGIAGAAIALNSYLVTGAVVAASGQAATAVVVALVVSVGIALELQRHHLRTLSEILRRRQAEGRLAQLNAELEQRVKQRTHELDGTMHRLEREGQENQQAERGFSRARGAGAPAGDRGLTRERAPPAACAGSRHGGHLPARHRRALRDREPLLATAGGPPRGGRRRQNPRGHHAAGGDRGAGDAQPPGARVAPADAVRGGDPAGRRDAHLGVGQIPAVRQRRPRGWGVGHLHRHHGAQARRRAGAATPGGAGARAPP